MESKGKKINSNLVLLLFGRMVSDIGSSIQMLIMPLYIIDIGGDAATIGLFSFLSLLPILLVYPFGGVLGDRLNRKMIMVGADISSAALVLILAVLSFFNMMNLAILLVIQALVSLAYGFFDPATKGMVPRLVPKEQLNQTNSKIATLRILSGLSAPLIAVTLYTIYGITLLFFINGISFLISGISEMFIKYKHTKKESLEGIRGILHDLSEGVKFIFKNKLIKNMSLFFLAVFAFIQPVFAVILPLFFRTKLNYSDTQYGFIQIALFLGALIGSILVGVLGKKGNLKKPFMFGVSAVFLFMLVFAVILFPGVVSFLGNSSPAYFILFASVMFMLYTSIMFIAVPVQTIIQKATPPDYMSRVFSIVGLISKGGMPLGALVYGLVLNKIAIHTASVISGVIIAIISVTFLISKSMREVKEF